MIVKKGEVISLMNGIYDEHESPMVVVRDFDLKVIAEEIRASMVRKHGHPPTTCFREQLEELGYLTKLKIWNVCLMLNDSGVELDVFQNVRITRIPQAQAIPDPHLDVES